MNHQVSSRLVAIDARNRVAEWPWPISKLARDRFAAAATAGSKDAAVLTTLLLPQQPRQDKRKGAAAVRRVGVDFKKFSS